LKTATFTRDEWRRNAPKSCTIDGQPAARTREAVSGRGPRAVGIGCPLGDTPEQVTVSRLRRVLPVLGLLAGCEAVVSSSATTESTGSAGEDAGASDSSGTGSDPPADSTGGVPLEICDGDVVGGGVSTPIVGTGATIMDVVEIGATLTHEDLGASLSITPVLTDDAESPATVTVTSIAEPTPASLFALGPIFEVRAEATGSVFVETMGAPVPERVGTCRPQLWQEDPDGSYVPGGGLVTLFAATPTVRLVLASACPAYTCGGECRDGTEEASCGGCNSCGEAVCITPGTCDGDTIGDAGAVEIHSDGTHLWWIDALEERTIVAASPPDPPIELATAEVRVLDLSVVDGVAYWIELTGGEIPGFDWVVRRVALGGLPETLYDSTVGPGCCDGLNAIRLAAGADAIVLLGIEQGETARLFRMPIDGGTPDPLLDGLGLWWGGEVLSGAWSLPRLRVHGDRVFALGLSDGSGNLVVRSGPIEGGSIDETNFGLMGLMNLPPASLAIDDTHLYYSLHGGIVQRVSRVGGTVDALGSAPAGGAFALHAGTVYFAGSDDETIHAVSPDLREAVLVEHEPARGIGYANGMVVWAADEPEGWSMRALAR